MAMEVISVVGSAFLSSLFEALFEKLSSHNLFKYASQGEVLSQIKKWESTLRTLYAVLDDAEEQQMTNRLINDWVTDLRDLAYDVDDILDEFATEALLHEMGIKTQASSSKKRRWIPSFFPGANSETRFNVEMVSKMAEITTRLEEISTKRSQLHLKEEARGRRSRVIERPPTTALVDETKVKGRESDHKAVVELLNKGGSDAGVLVVSIVGMGGVGKTTLAQLIINDANLEFDSKAWLCVGDDFHIVKMTKTLLQNLGGDSTSDDLNLLQLKLKEKLSGKKFLIVLDDVWTENYDHWTLFRGPLEAGAQGSRIIVTTRNLGVSSMMAGSSTQTYPLELLSNEDCLSILAQHALGEPNFHSHLDLRELGLQIVKRCKGLPLAAKAIGGLLRGRPNSCSWEEVLNDEVWDIPEDKSDILPALRLSYYHLPSHLKRCFAYCAIFPRDFEFEKNDLKLLWMAEGFLQEPRKTTKQRRDLGEEYFNELFSRCFFQKSSSGRSTFVMHDLINDLAQSVSGGVCFQLDDKMKNANMKVRHSSFMPHKYDVMQRFEVLFGHSDSLWTFIALTKFSSRYAYGKQYHLTSKVLLELLPKLKCLRVLSLSGYSFAELPSSIGKLKHLRYLNLSYSNIERLPESVSELINLQTLILRGCKRLIELPLGTCNLVDLTHLDISGTENLRNMPPKFGQLSKLCTLSKFIVGDGSDSRINELQKFTHLQGQLQITNLQNVVDIQDAKHANLHMRHCLDNLLLEWDAYFIGSQNEMVELQVLNSLQPHENLEELTVKGYGGMDLPMWIGDPSFKKMVFLELNNCSKITSLPPVGRLPFLVELIINGIDGVKEVGPEFLGNASPAFPSLETLTFVEMSRWERWCWSNPPDEDVVAKFPKLTNLTISRCPELIGEFPSSLPSLRKLGIFDCPQLIDFPQHLPSLDELDITRCQEVVLRSVSSIASLTTLRIGEISGLESLHHSLNALDKVSSLKRLDIRSCHQLMSLEDGENGLFPCDHLEELTIFSCSMLEKLPNELHNLRSLKALDVSGCPKLVSFPATGLPFNLRGLSIRNCQSITLLPEGIMVDTSNKTSYLGYLDIVGCDSIMSIPTGRFPNSIDARRICHWKTQLLELLNQNERLTCLTIVDSPRLELFPVNGLSIPNLTWLRLQGCKNLRSLPNHMDKLISLRHLGIESCTGLESFPKRGFPPNLITIGIRRCSNLSQPMSEWGLHRLNSLTGIIIEGTCPSTDMVYFPDKDGHLLPDSLTSLWLLDFKNLKFISSGLLKLTSLRSLVIWHCPELQYLPKEGLPASLGGLNIRNCPHLKKQYSKGNRDHWAIISHIPYVNLESICFIHFE